MEEEDLASSEERVSVCFSPGITEEEEEEGVVVGGAFTTALSLPSPSPSDVLGRRVDMGVRFPLERERDIRWCAS